jgi:hypothetical protein
VQLVETALAPAIDTNPAELAEPYVGLLQELHLRRGR